MSAALLRYINEGIDPRGADAEGVVNELRRLADAVERNARDFIVHFTHRCGIDYISDGSGTAADCEAYRNVIREILAERPWCGYADTCGGDIAVSVGLYGEPFDEKTFVDEYSEALHDEAIRRGF